MLRSLRAKLVVFTILPLVVAAAIMVPLALRAFDDYQDRRNDDALAELQEQSAALAELYGKQARAYFALGGEPTPVQGELARITGSELFYVERALPAEAVALPVLPGIDVDWAVLDTGASQTLSDVTLPGRDERYLVVVTGIFIGAAEDETGATPTPAAPATDEDVPEGFGDEIPQGFEDVPQGFDDEVPQGFPESEPVPDSQPVDSTAGGADPDSTALVEPAVGAFALVTPAEDLSESGAALARRVAPAFAVAVGVAILLGLYLAWSLSRPLQSLVTAAGAIGRGRYDVALDRERRDEIGVVNRAFGDMVDRLREAEEHERLFLMRVSHELRTPLTAIRAHVQALADGVIDEDEERNAAYDVIGDEAARLGRLIGDLLDLARLEAHRFTLLREEVDLEALLEHACQSRREDARQKGVEVVSSFGGAPTITGDGDRILQIVGNLIGNAVRWTPAGGTVRVESTTIAGAVRIVVADSGPGIPPERREHVFRPFYSEDARGTGLGLAIAAELAVAMGGSVAVDSAPEGGALFTVTLPLVGVPPASRSATPA